MVERDPGRTKKDPLHHELLVSPCAVQEWQLLTERRRANKSSHCKDFANLTGSARHNLPGKTARFGAPGCSEAVAPRPVTQRCPHRPGQRKAKSSASCGAAFDFGRTGDSAVFSCTQLHNMTRRRRRRHLRSTCSLRELRYLHEFSLCHPKQNDCDPLH